MAVPNQAPVSKNTPTTAVHWSITSPNPTRLVRVLFSRREAKVQILQSDQTKLEFAKKKIPSVNTLIKNITDQKNRIDQYTYRKVVVGVGVRYILRMLGVYKV